MTSPNLPVNTFVDIARLLYCPVEGSLLTHAVNLYPCNHKVNEIAVAQIGGICPTCNGVVQDQSPDGFVRNLIDRLIDSRNAAEGLTLVSAQSEPERCISYPWPRARFVSVGSWWTVCNSEETPLIRTLGFWTRTTSSVFQKISLLGYRDGSIAICVEFDRENKDRLLSFFDQLGVSIDRNMDTQSTWAINNDIRIVFAVLARNNTFQETEIGLMSQIIEAGDWTTITPLRPEEQIIITPVNEYRRAWFAS